MIKAVKHPTFKSTYLLSSITTKKSATLVKFSQGSWQIKYDHNGARKSVSSYHEALEHLKKQGW